MVNLTLAFEQVVDGGPNPVQSLGGFVVLGVIVLLAILYKKNGF